MIIHQLDAYRFTTLGRANHDQVLAASLASQELWLNSLVESRLCKKTHTPLCSHWTSGSMPRNEPLWNRYEHYELAIPARKKTTSNHPGVVWLGMAQKEHQKDTEFPGLRAVCATFHLWNYFFCWGVSMTLGSWNTWVCPKTGIPISQ